MIRGLRIVSFTAVVLFGSKAISFFNCPPVFQFTKTGGEIERAAFLESFDASPSQFCDRELGKRFLSTPYERESRTPEAMNKASQEEIESAERSGTFNELLLDRALKEFPKLRTAPWVMTLVPLEETRRAALKSGLETIPEAEIDDHMCTKPRGGANQLNQKMSMKELGIENLPQMKKFACAELLGLGSTGKCDQAVDVVARISTPPSRAVSVTGFEIFEKVANDARYDEGLKIAARKVLEKARGGPLDSKSLFEDLVDSFISAGRSKDEAREMTWNTMGLLATGGANLDSRIGWMKSLYRFSNSKAAALYHIAVGLPIVDHRSSAKGRLYSWPEGVEGACNTGKSYHFWYAAYLARRAALETGKPDAAAAAAYQSAKLYHVSGRNATKSMKVSSIPTSTFSPTANIVRGDLAYAAAGAKYGAASSGAGPAPRLNVDQGLRALIAGADRGETILVDRALTWYGGSVAERYLSWKAVYNPNTAFHAHNVQYPKKTDSFFREFEKTAQTTSCAQ